MSDTHPDSDLLERLEILSRVFRPSGPVDHQDLFSGRIDQLSKIHDVSNETSQHGVIFGERGVGKTSLAAVSVDIASARKLAMRINCDGNDDFRSMWEKVVDELIFRANTNHQPWGDTFRAEVERTIEILHADVAGPDRVRQALRTLSAVVSVIIFFDEFDQIEDRDVRRLYAGTIKTLSDHLVDATLIAVGVADDVDDLISEHTSIQRNLVQVRMPRMTVDEIKGIIVRGYSELNLTVSPAALQELALLPRGLPHYGHLLAQEAARPAIYDSRFTITDDDIQVAIAEAISRTDQSIVRAYTDATTSSHSYTLYEDVLLACALAKTDDLGFFAPADVREPLSDLKGEQFDIPRFAGHLFQFCTDHGPVLERRGGERRWRYRFINPLMQPYLVMRGINDGRLHRDSVAD